MITVSPATESDVPQILEFIRGLAEYEKLSHLCTATVETLTETLFGQRRFAEALIARLDSKPVGHAIFFHSYSTFLAKPGIYLEDLYVVPEHRGVGAGKAMLQQVAKIAHERGCARLEWAVLDWNQPAIDFYLRMGATMLPEWRICRVSEHQLKAFSGS